MDKGELVDDALVISVVENIFLEKPSIGSTLFDGFPRTLKQAEALDVMMARLERKIDKVVEIRVSDSFLIARMSGRLFCSGCGTTYHREFNPAKRVGICDNCGVKLITRSDDEEIVVESRLELYHAESVPLLDYYRAEGKLVVVDGEGSIDQIAERVTSVLTVIKL
jgi:adenylate kinase